MKRSLSFKKSVNHFFFQKSHFVDLEFSRIFFYFLVFLTNINSQHYLVSEFSSSFWTPRPLFQFMSWPLPTNILIYIELAWLFSLLLSSIGLFTRGSMIVSALLGTFVFGLSQNFGGLYNDSMITLLCLWVFAISKAGQYLSLDRYLGRVKESIFETLTEEYHWPLKTAQLLTCFSFFSAGYSKLLATGFTWSMPHQFIFILRKIDVSYARPFWDNPSSIFLTHALKSNFLNGFLGHVILYSELLAILAPFVRPIRLVVIPILFFMIVSNIHLMGLDFNRFIPVFVFWVPWSKFVFRTKVL